jgi:hypothetical protein
MARDRRLISMAKPRGQQPVYTQKAANTICKGLSAGGSLRQVCADENVPSESTVRGWVVDDREGFAAQYTRAREIGYHMMADELLGIADDGTNDYTKTDDGERLNAEHVQRSRLRLDTRKWLLSKALPKIYGDKITHDGKIGLTVIIPDEDAGL